MLSRRELFELAQMVAELLKTEPLSYLVDPGPAPLIIGPITLHHADRAAVVDGVRIALTAPIRRAGVPHAKRRADALA